MRALTGQQLRLFTEAAGWSSYCRVKLSNNGGASFPFDLTNLFPNPSTQPTGNNYALHSGDMSNAAWIASNVGSSNPSLDSASINGVDGIPAACEYTFPAIGSGSNDSVLYQDFSGSLAAGQWTWSVWMATPRLGGYFPQQVWLFIRDITAGTTIASYSCTVTSQFKRFQCSGIVPAGHDIHASIGYNAAANSVFGAPMTGAGGTFDMELPQMEPGASAGPNVPTVGSPVVAGISNFPIVARGGLDFFNGAELDKSIDQQIDSATLSLIRAHGFVNLSMMMTGSRANAPGAMVAPASGVEIDVATLPNGRTPQDAQQPVGSNYLLASQGAFGASPWSTASSGGPTPPTIFDNLVAAPDGSMTASTVVFQACSTTGKTSYLQQSLVAGWSGAATLSFEAQCTAGAGAQFFAILYDITAAAVLGSKLITSTADVGWNQFSISGTFVAGNTVKVMFGFAGFAGETGAGGAFNLWGGNLDQTGGPYVATTTAPVQLGTSLWPWLSDWQPIYQGVIGQPEFSQPILSVTCRDNLGYIQDTWIQQDLPYGIWQKNRTTLPGYVIVTSASKLGSPAAWQYWQSGGGVANGTAEPSWPSNPTIGTTLTDGSITWTYCGEGNAAAADTRGTLLEVLAQQILNDCWLGPGNVPVLQSKGAKSGWYIQPYMQSSMSALDAIMALVNQIGFDFRELWNPTIAGFSPTIIDVPRTSPAVVFTWSPDQYQDVQEANIGLDGIRTRVNALYSDFGNIDPTTLQPMIVSTLFGAIGPPAVAALGIAINSAAEEIWNPHYMAIAYEACPQVDNTVVAALANNILADLSQPVLNATLLSLAFPYAELHDFYQYLANGRVWDSTQSLAVVSLKHTWTAQSPGSNSNGSQVESSGGPPSASSGSSSVGGRTTIGVRGAPAGGYQKWLAMEAAPGKAALLKTSAVPLPSIAAPTATSAPTGAHLQMATGAFIRHLNIDTIELHISTTASFTPSAAGAWNGTTSTLFHAGKQTQWDVHGLTAGHGYFHKVVLRDHRQNKVIGVEGSFTAGYLELTGLDPALTQNFSVRLSDGNDQVFVNNADFPIPFDVASYDQDDIYDVVHYVANPIASGRMWMSVRAFIYGASAGDTASLVVQQKVGSLWQDVIPSIYGRVDTLEDRPFNVNVLQICDTFYVGVSTNPLRLIVRPIALTSPGTANWTLKAEDQFGQVSGWGCSQQLSS